MQSFHPNRFGKFDALALAAVVLVGLINLPMPFGGDQALFTIGAAKLHGGAVLYRDFWDLKQPGIYWFYLLAGTLFGFNEVGVHTLELLYLAAFSVVLIYTLKSYYKHAGVATVVPLLTVGFYYGVAGSWHLTQVEALIGFPLFLALWFASAPPGSEGRRSWRLFLSGLMGGIVLVFKLMFLPILVGFWVTCLVDAVVRRRERRWTVLAKIGVPILFGLLCPVAAVGLYFARFGELGLLYKTFIEYPPRIITELPSSGLAPFVFGLLWFAGQFAPLLSLAFVGVCLSLGRRRDMVTINLILWVVLGFLVILLQRRSGWAYQYLLLVVPLGALTGLGLDALWGHLQGLGAVLTPRKGFALLAVSLILLFSPILASWCQKAIFLAYYRYGPGAHQPLAYESHLNREYPRIAEEVAFLAEPGSRPGDIFVCGDPVYYFLSGRNQAGALNGWALELYLPEQWVQLRHQLERSRPPYIFIDPTYAELIPQRSPEVMLFLNQNYRVFHKSAAGTWYLLSEHDVSRSCFFQLFAPKC